MKRALLAFVAAGLLSAGTLTAAGQHVSRIRFARGAEQAVVSGSLRGYGDKRTYVIRVRRGQTLQTEQVGDSHHITIYVKSPLGDDVGDSDASCNDRRMATPTAAGDYRITVVECRKADPWRGRFRFRVSVR